MFALIILLTSLPTAGELSPEFTIELRLGGKRIEGAPLKWDAEKVHLLGRDGRLWEFPPDEAQDFRATGGRFRPYSAGELRAALLQELGPSFEVTGTTHYMIAHAAGQRDVWAERFEQLHRDFTQYFQVRGCRLQAPPLPLVGIVCRNQAEFGRYAASQGIPSVAGVLGFYDPTSNRIILYDRGNRGAGDWKKTANVLIHESTHQTAFNVGIHSRYTLPPRWAAEGLAMMFEAPGVYDARNHPERSERINRERFAAFNRGVRAKHKPELLQDLVASDRIFGVAPGAAYAESWALTFFLCETMPKQYADYLMRTARRPAFVDYTAEQRVADFTASFGSDWKMLESRMLRFLAGLE